MGFKDLMSIQDNIVMMTADAIHGDWAAAVVNMEIDEIDGELQQNCICLWFQQKMANRCVKVFSCLMSVTRCFCR